MGKIFDEPKHPVIEKTPEFSSIVTNFNLRDLSLFAGTTAVSFPLGYWIGARPSPAYSRIMGNPAIPTMWTTAFIGAMAGFMFAYQNSAGRLMGFAPNEKEAKAAGLIQ